MESIRVGFFLLWLIYLRSTNSSKIPQISQLPAPAAGETTDLGEIGRRTCEGDWRRHVRQATPTESSGEVCWWLGVRWKRRQEWQNPWSVVKTLSDVAGPKDVSRSMEWSVSRVLFWVFQVRSWKLDHPKKESSLESHLPLFKGG